MKRLGVFSSIALVAAIALTTHAARASAPGDVGTARELYKQGADALDAGNTAIALEKLTAAWALVQTPVIGYDLARAHEKLRHLLEARESALAVMRLPATSNETSLSTEARTKAEKLADALAARIPHVKIALSGVDPAHATVKLDGSVVPSVALSIPHQVDPGDHVVIVETDDGRHGEARVIVGESETREASIRLSAATSPATPVHETVVTHETTPAPIAEKTHASISPLVWVGAVVTGAGLVVGAITGGIAIGGVSALHNECTAVNGSYICDPTRAGELSSAQTMGTVSTVSFIVAGVGAGVLVTGLILSGGKSSSKTRARVLPMIGPISGLSGTF